MHTFLATSSEGRLNNREKGDFLVAVTTWWKKKIPLHFYRAEIPILKGTSQNRNRVFRKGGRLAEPQEGNCLCKHRRGDKLTES